MIDRHTYFWPDADALAHDFSVARTALLRSHGVSTANNPILGPASDLAQSITLQDDQDRLAWPDLELDWDSFFSADADRFIDSLVGNVDGS